MAIDLGGGFLIGRGVLWYRGKPPETPGEAWAITVEKWTKLSAHPGVRDGGGATCGLCMIYGGNNACHGCPISNACCPGCVGTPYMMYYASPTRENAMAMLRFLMLVANAQGHMADGSDRTTEREGQDE